jgi:folate-binding protein YgfZ
MQTAEKRNVLDTPLATLQQRAGAQLGVWFGCNLPSDFGDWREEFRLAHDSVALADKNYRAYISFTGPDRVRYLHAILTNDVKSLSPGQGIVSLLLNAQGHILAEIETYALLEQLFCVSYAMIRQSLIETFDKYIIMDDVTLTDETQRYATLALEGPAAARLTAELTGVDLNALPELGRQDAHIGGIACTVSRRSPGNFAGAEFLVERQHAENLWRVLEEKARAAGGGPVGYVALSALRLEQGIPWFGYDFGEKQIPNEAGLLETHLSFTKGCYTGQEIVERVRSRGHINRQRVHLNFSGTRVPQAGDVLTADGNEVGFVTRAALHPLLGFPIGMGYVRRENNGPGSELRWKEGTARVSRFPDDLTAARDRSVAS